jgi:hypothetical protein
MSTESFLPDALEMFGGWLPNAAPESLPEGAALDCQDVTLEGGGVRTRPGLVAQFPALAGGPAISYLKTYRPAPDRATLLALDTLGRLWAESTPGQLAPVATDLAQDAQAHSVTAFGREYLALGDGIVGVDLPRQWDGVHLDRVSQDGPGAPPVVSDLVVNIVAATRAGNTVTVTTATPHYLRPGDSVTVAGTTGASLSFDGTWTVTAVGSPTAFSYAQTGPNESASGGTATPVGSIAAGTHQVAVSFVTRQGYWTRPSPVGQWTAAGGRKALVQNIPTGPANVVARLLLFTPAGQAGAPSFYHLDPGPPSSPSSMRIADNTTTEVAVDFSDAALLGGLAAGYLFDLIELPEMNGVIVYNNRLFWWGERVGSWSGKSGVWLNLGFDGGWAGAVPLGWTADPTTGAGGSRETQQVAWGDAYRITGDGSSAVRGRITQPAVRDAAGVALIAPNTEYTVRARVLAGGGLTQGTLHINLASASAGLVTAGLAVSATQAPTGGFAEFTAQLTPPLASVPDDLVLQVYADGTPTAGGWFIVDNIQIAPTALGELAGSVVRASRINDPESYDGVRGLLLIGPDDGQRITAAFVLRNNLYFVKENALWVTTDDGVNEPALWPVQKVSDRVGTPSAAGVALADDAVLVCGREGVYSFDGSVPQKLSQEIATDRRGLAGGPGPVWDRVNWAAGHRLWAVADVARRRLLVGVPTGSATAPDTVLVLHYEWGSDAVALASRWYLFRQAPLARGWVPWRLAAAAAALVERPDGTRRLWLGGPAGSGKIYELAEGAWTDDGAPIAASYTTAFLAGADALGAAALGRKLYGWLRLRLAGAGPVAVALLVAPDAGQIVTATRTASLLTVQTAAPHGLVAGQRVELRGLGPGLDAITTVLTVPAPDTFTCASAGPDTSVTGGTVALSAGVVTPQPGRAADYDFPLNVAAERLAVRVATAPGAPAGSWFRLAGRLVLYLKPDPWSPEGAPWS